MTQSIAWGIVGSGAAARRFADGLLHVPHASAAAIWSRNSDTAAQLAAHSGATPCASLQTLLAQQIDAVYIATLPDTHAQYASAALQAGKHVLCEKPVMRSEAELAAVLELARRSKLLFMEAMKPPFFPLYQRLRRHLLGDPIGQVAFVRAGHALSDVAPEHPSWHAHSGGGSLMGIGVYPAFLAVDWLGPAHDLQAVGRLSPGGVDAFACVQTMHDHGFAQIYSGLDLSGPGEAVLAAPYGYVTIQQNWWNPTSATVHCRDGRIVALHEPFVGSGFNYETAHFCDLLRRRETESPVITHQLSTQVMSLLDRARATLTGSR